MIGEWQELIQTAIIGLIFSFLVAKLISIVTAFKDDKLTISRAPPAPADLTDSDPAESMSEAASGFGDDNSVVAEKISSVGSADGVDPLLDDEDDWEGVESTELDEAFSAATAFVAASVADRLTVKVPNETQLRLYALYKIATEGPCTAPPPAAFKLTARAKCDPDVVYSCYTRGALGMMMVMFARQAWNKMGAMPPEDAMQKYVEIVTELFPSWANDATNRSKAGDSDALNVKPGGPVGPVLSTLIHEEYGNALKMDPIHAFAREGDADNLLRCIENGVSVNLKDSEGRTPLHWAVDRGHLNIIELLASRNGDVNAKDNEGQTPLHYAVVCDRENIAEYLMKQNADANMKDNDGTSPIDLCERNWPWLQKQTPTPPTG